MRWDKMTNDRLSSSMRDANFKYITLNCTLMLLPRYFCLYYFSLFLSHHSYSTSLVQKQLLEQSYKGRSWWRRWRSKVVNKDWLLLQVCAQQTRARQERERERERERDCVLALASESNHSFHAQNILSFSFCQINME